MKLADEYMTQKYSTELHSFSEVPDMGERTLTPVHVILIEVNADQILQWMLNTSQKKFNYFATQIWSYFEVSRDDILERLK